MVYSLIPEPHALIHLVVHADLLRSLSLHIQQHVSLCSKLSATSGPTCLSGVPSPHTSVTTQLLLLTLVSLDTQPSGLAGHQLNPRVDGTYTAHPRHPPASIWAFVYFQIHFKRHLNSNNLHSLISVFVLNP